MGDLIGDVVESELYYVPTREFERVRKLNAARPQIVSLYADMARLNALYMIARAGSGHIGSSFSSLDILSHLYLSEMDRDDGDVFFSSKGHDAPALYAVLIARRHPAGRQAACVCAGSAACPAIRTSARPASSPIPARSAWASPRPRACSRPTASPARRGRVFVMTGDGELQEGQIWESLVSAANDGHRRAHRDRRPQQVPVGLLRSSAPRPRRSRGQVSRLRLACRARRRPRPRRARRALRRAARGSPTSRRSSSPTRSRARASPSWKAPRSTPTSRCSTSTPARRRPTSICARSRRSRAASRAACRARAQSPSRSSASNEPVVVPAAAGSRRGCSRPIPRRCSQAAERGRTSSRSTPISCSTWA